MLSKSKIQTQKLAIRLVKKILKANRPERSRRATLIALRGDLGSGKTTFVQGFMKALGVKHHITSPTFVIFRKYKLGARRKAQGARKLNSLTFSSEGGSASGGNLKPLTCAYHFDLYRINKLKEILNLGFRKIINNPENIVLIEWPELVKKQLPKNTIWVEFEHGKNKNGRVLKIKTTHFG